MINSTVLSNGVRIISQRAEQMHTVSIGIWVADGARYETEADNGIAHFIEHLMFKGTPSRTAKQISREIDSMGGVLNAFTGHEYVCYYAKVLASFLPRATELLSDIFLNSNFPDDEIERERKVVLQEIKMRDDSPDECIHDHYHQNFWRGSSLGYSVLGTEQSIARIRRNDIIRYKEQHYRPDRIIISVAGNMQHKELVKLLEGEFSKIKTPVFPAVSGGVLTDNSGYHINLIERDLEQTLICLGTNGLPQDDPGRYQLFMLSTILGGGMSSRLFEEIREKHGLAYSVYACLLSHADAGSLLIYAGTEEAHCKQVVEIIMREMGRLKREPIPPEELKSAMEQVKGNLLMSLESTDSMMSRLAKNEIYLRRYQPVDEVLAGIDAVTSDDIICLANKLFDGNRLNLEVLGRTSKLDLKAEELVF